jgi:hypothetical protein
MNEMIGFWTNWIETVRFACEAQGVIVARLALLASGGPSAAAEADLMISEKVVAFADAKAAAEGAPLRHRVHVNSRRLLRTPRPQAYWAD